MGVPELRHLRYFLAVAEELNFTRAARRLHIAQPSLSAQIRELERRVGCQLLRRTTREVRLTPAGEVLRARAEHVVAAAEDALAATRAAAAGVAGPLRVVIEADADRHEVEAVRAFAAAHPDVSLRVSRLHEGDARAALLSGRVDAAILWVPPAPEEPLQACAIRQVESLGVVPAAAHADAGRPPRLSRSAFLRSPLALWPREADPVSFDYWTAIVAGSEGPEPRIVAVPLLDRAQDTMLDAVAAGSGVTICTVAHWQANARSDLAAVPLDPPLVTPILLAWRDGDARPAIRALARWLADDGRGAGDASAGPGPSPSQTTPTTR